MHVKSTLGATAGVLALLAIAPKANATPATYQFIAGSSIQWQQCNGALCGAGPSNDISGSFTYDPSTEDMSGVDIVLTGTAIGAGGAAGTYTLPDNPEGPSTFAVFNADGFVEFKFATPLSGSADTLDTAANADQFCLGCGGGGAVKSFTASGGVVVVPTAAPEPPSAAILASALGLLFFGRRAVRRTARGHAAF